MADEKLAHYRCRRCEAEWKHLPAPTQCPHCGSVVVVWLNFAEILGSKKRNGNEHT